MVFDSVELASTWFRLIPSRFPPVSLYERVAPEADWEVLHSIEDLTNPRVQARKVLTGRAQIDEASARLQNWNHAPFTYLNPEGTWLLDPYIGALELYDCLQTALASSVRKRELFLSRTQEPPLDLDMRVLCTRVEGTFADLRDLDPLLTQSARWQIGEQLLQTGVGGAVFQSPHRDAGDCLAVFTGDVLQRSVQSEHYRFVWDGASIKSIYSFNSARKLLPERIFSSEPLEEAA